MLFRSLRQEVGREQGLLLYLPELALVHRMRLDRKCAPEVTVAVQHVDEYAGELALEVVE